ncbi:hypothetical protein FACS1894132_13960 [Clostridia bacterium]|nr:hypothetical protein FACS1894132_13960 [Clostridia bacterium]
MTGSIYSKGEIYFAKLDYVGIEGSKARPVLIISDNSDSLTVIALKITKHLPRVLTDYRLKYWMEAGLNYESTVVISEPRIIKTSNIFFKIGDIAEYDWSEILKILQKIT